MHSLGRCRMVIAAVAAAALSACGGGSSPTAPEMPGVGVVTGAQVLRVILQGQCPPFEGRLFAPVVYTRVTVTREGNDWVARASSAAGGTVELRLHQSGPSLLSGTLPVQGTIRGIANHSFDVSAGPSAWAARADFGTDARNVLDGFVFAAGSLSPTPSTSGLGNGSLTMSDADGRSSCASSTFLWTLAAAP